MEEELLYSLGSRLNKKGENEQNTGTSLFLSSLWRECDQLPQIPAIGPFLPWWTLPSNYKPKYTLPSLNCFCRYFAAVMGKTTQGQAGMLFQAFFAFLLHIYSHSL